MRCRINVKEVIPQRSMFCKKQKVYCEKELLKDYMSIAFSLDFLKQYEVVVLGEEYDPKLFDKQGIFITTNYQDLCNSGCVLKILVKNDKNYNDNLFIFSNNGCYVDNIYEVFDYGELEQILSFNLKYVL